MPSLYFLRFAFLGGFPDLWLFQWTWGDKRRAIVRQVAGTQESARGAAVAGHSLSLHQKLARSAPTQ